MKKILSLVLVLVLSIAVFAGCNTNVGQGENPTPTLEATPEYKSVDFKIGALMGPTGMGMSKLMADAEAKSTANNNTFELFNAPTDITAL